MLCSATQPARGTPQKKASTRLGGHLLGGVEEPPECMWASQWILRLSDFFWRMASRDIVYENDKGLRVIGYDEVRAALRERFAVDADQLSTEALMGYVSQWRQEVDWLDENPAAKERPVQPRVDKEDVRDDLWERHIPEKNTYVDRDGRKVIHRRVFQRRDAPGWSLDNCHYCLCPGVVCRNHQFELIGNKGVDAYVAEVMQTGWFRHAWYPSCLLQHAPSVPLTDWSNGCIALDSDGFEFSNDRLCCLHPFPCCPLAF